MKSAIAATLIASAAAFAPAKVANTNTALKGFESELGSQPPIGFFDPLGLLDDADQERFDRLRYVEIKHGRISQLAVLGHIVTSSGARLPGYIDLDGTKFSDVPSGLAAFDKISAPGLMQILFFIGVLELNVMKDTGLGEFPGDFRNGYMDFGWDSFDEETKLQKRAIELNNGRAAMMGILALMVHEKLPSHDPYMLNDLLAGLPVDFNAGY
eukprot:CAMPEP_0116057802 /NCGR_PEP_ID=MMETSP0322-20121206/4826_1 /TAXON_ID=163516 /ORGANISM="Leptocylindrus danicus var. apora, Strain B651" /LENGTH=211 /DNA_ID=CAMNT_0003541879 /DNA_START=135 /DNA_END=770 /DNA_ORIENTATION=-